MNAQTQGHHHKAEPHPFTEFNPDGSVKFDFDKDGPVFYEDSKVLILGSFPSESSKDDDFYYGNSRNRFWFILGTLFNEPNLKDKTKDEKKKFLRDKKIALWDIWAYCYKIPENSSEDKYIQPEPDSQKVDLTELFAKAKEIQMVFTTIGGSEMSKNERDRRGGRFKKWGIEEWLKKYGKSVIPLFSTSSNSPYANNKAMKIGCPKLFADYRKIKDFLEKIHAI